jgi:tryptophan 2,3-dioxygenase
VSESRRVDDYADYLCLDQLLCAQQPLTDQHDEMLFLVIHHSTELWLKQILHEIDAATGWIQGGDMDPALKALARVSRIQALITQSWDILSTLTPPDYLTFRNALGKASGFQSIQFRLLECRLGLKDRRYLAAFADKPEERARLEAALCAMSLYDAALCALAHAGIALPQGAGVASQTQYEHNEGVRDAWLEVYRAPERYWQLYALAEKLVDLEDGFRQWRFRHVTTVERVIGRKTGTGGTSGVDYLHKGLEKWCFPELWSVRTAL